MTRGSNDTDLVQRSNAYYSEDVLDTKRWAKIAEVPDYNEIIAGFDWADAFSVYSGRSSIAILDCGCGIGHFPNQLRKRVTLPTEVAFDYDTLDPSPYSLTEHRKNLEHPFNPRNSFNSAIEDFHPVPWVSDYDIIWCMHSLYTVPRARLSEVVWTLRCLLAPNGRCFVFLPKKQSAYMAMFDLYLAEMAHDHTEPYLTAEDVLAELAEQQARSVDSVDCAFEHNIDADEPLTLATYLNQICLRPTPLTVDEWRQNTTFARYLDEAFDRDLSVWRFQQELNLISFS
jgi:SAM-dependent methyltransferase